MEIQLLREKQTPPTEQVIENALGHSFKAFKELMNVITTNYGLNPEWNYYNDGKAWLCKVVHKKKTIFWLSVWDKFFKVVFYFTERNCPAIAELVIDEKIKDDFGTRKPIGKLIPLVIFVENIEQISDILKIVEYKKSLK